MKRGPLYSILIIFLILVILVIAFVFLFYRNDESDVENEIVRELNKGVLSAHNCFMSCPHSNYYYKGLSDDRYFYYFTTEEKIITECWYACNEKYWYPIYREHRYTDYYSNVSFDDFDSCNLDEGKDIYDNCIISVLENYSNLSDLTSERLSANYTNVELDLVSLNCREDGIDAEVEVVSPPIGFNFDTKNEVVFVFVNGENACDNHICSDFGSAHFELVKGLRTDYSLN